MNMVGRDGSRLQKEVFTPNALTPIESYDQDGCGFGDIEASHLLPISTSQFGRMYWEGKDSLCGSQCTDFYSPLNQLANALGIIKGFLWPVLLQCQWEKEGLCDTGAFLSPVFRDTCDRAQMLEDDPPRTIERAHSWELFFPLSLWGWEDQQKHLRLSLRQGSASLGDPGSQLQAHPQ